ncbi:hypothetical protein GIB67_004629 [Kingdonia uniflora]|uniref:Amidase domain-containing protein n=1 Tax=Kingdonia uniflora TaxID=39325 RepID=A0A7J7MDD2_9MAGN|nr:hypothetical protein GIB67_004629 [Kingdonia uniflora]
MILTPRMTGCVIKIFTWILESRLIGSMLLYLLVKANLIHKLISFAEFKEPPTYVPTHPWEDLEEQEIKTIKPGMSPPEQVEEAMDSLPICPKMTENCQHSFQRWTIQDYSRAYTAREVTPLMVAERFLAAVNESSNPALQMSFFISYNPDDILKKAHESTLRYEKGEPISILDGVLIAVKDEIDCTPYPTTGGTTWLHKVRPCTDDACCIKHLRSCGAIIVGKTNMHELGLGTSGINPHYGPSRNPYDPSKISGGSSSGSATVVSAGLCPVAIGVDGGGSVRMPAALCGIVGLKPTFGRVSHSGVLPFNWTIGMVGVLAGTVEDALITYAAISGNLPQNQPNSLQPRVDIPLLKSKNTISNIKMAKYKETVEVTIPEIEVMRLAHYITIGSECHASLASRLEKLNTAELGWDARVALRVYSTFTSKEYLNAQRIRNRQLYIYKEIFKKADIIVTPTTGVTAYPIDSDAIKNGEFDYVNGAALIRYQIAGNFLGFPAVSVPVGYDKQGMPIGLQFIGRPWSEATLIHMAYAVQEITSHKKPKVFYDLLKKEQVE